MSFYPVNLKISGLLCVVVGGGPVALRKVRGLLDCGAVIRIVSPYVEPELKEIIFEKQVEWLEREYVEGDLQAAFLGFAATGDQDVQRQVKRDAEKYGIMLNYVDNPEGSDFHVPAHFRRGKMLVTVSTGGGSPALSKQIREWLEGEIGVEYEAIVDFLAMVREAVVGRDDDSASHKELFQKLLKVDIVRLIRERNWFDLQMVLLKELPGDIDSAALIKRFLQQHEAREGGCQCEGFQPDNLTR